MILYGIRGIINLSTTMQKISKKWTILLALIFIFSSVGEAAAGGLTIFNLGADVNGTEVIVSWQTNEASTGCVQYGLTTDYEWQLCAVITPSTQHTLELTNLQAKKVYHYRIVSKTAQGVEVNSFDSTFKTGELTDRSRPELSNLSVEFVGGKEAFITWETNEPTNTRVEYGINSINEKKYENGSLVTRHEVRLRGLQTSTRYEYQVSSADKAGNRVYASVQSIRTYYNDSIDKDTLKILEVRPIGTNDSGIADTSAVISWRTSRPANSAVKYGTDPTRLNKRVTAPEHETFHSITLVDLQPGTVYYYEITSRDFLGKQTVSPGNNGAHSFTTNGRAIVAGAATNIKTGPTPQPAVLTNLKNPQAAQIQRTPQVLGAFTTVYTPAQALLKPLHSNQIYAILKGKKYLIANEETFASYGYQFQDVRMVSKVELDSYPEVQLVKTPDSSTIYFLYTSQGIVIDIPSEQIFTSYPGNKWEDVVTISARDLENYEKAKLVKIPERDTIYLIENNQRRIILSQEAFKNNNFDYAKVATINNDHLLTFPLGESIK